MKKTKPLAFVHAVGDWVSVIATHESYRNGTDEEALTKVIARLPLEKPVLGQVVGVKTLLAGESTPTSKVRQNYGMEDYEPDYGYFSVKKTLICYEVRLGMRTKPIYVAPADLTPAVDHPARLPWNAPARPAFIRKKDAGGWPEYAREVVA